MKGLNLFAAAASLLAQSRAEMVRGDEPRLTGPRPYFTSDKQRRLFESYTKNDPGYSIPTKGRLGAWKRAAALAERDATVPSRRNRIGGSTHIVFKSRNRQKAFQSIVGALLREGVAPSTARNQALKLARQVPA